MERNYFQIGDIVTCENVWGQKRFEIDRFFGNSYCQMVSAYRNGKLKINKNKLNLVLEWIKLVDAKKRPLKNVKQDLLLKLLKNGNKEAKRELIIRTAKI